LLSKNILISDPISDDCVRVFQDAGYSVTRRDKVPVPELLDIIKQYDGLVVRSGTQVTEAIINAGTRLKIVGRAGSGTDNIDSKAATRAGVVVMNTPGGNTASAAELTVSLLLALSRNIPQANQSLKAGQWKRSSFSGTETSGKTVGIVGLGQIGRHVAKALQGLGMRTIGYDPLLSAEVARSYNIEKVDLADIYRRSDYITLHTPLTSETKNLFNTETFALCKTGVRIINCARGGIINDDALLNALNSGKVAGAALDVFETEPPPASLLPLLNHPNVICTPHLGASTQEAQSKVAVDIANQMVDAFEDRTITGAVNASILTKLATNKALRPFIDLAERLGAAQAQLVTGNIQSITLGTRGSLVSGQADILAAAALKGMLTHLVETPVNFVNAPVLAAQMGLSIESVSQDNESQWGNSITLTVYTDRDSIGRTGTRYKKLVGALVSGVPRVVQVNEFLIDFVASGELMFFANKDVPRALADLCNAVSSEGGNIETLNLGRVPGKDIATGVFSTDEPLPASTLAAIKSLPNILSAQVVRLPSLKEDSRAIASDSHNPRPDRKPASANFSSGPTKKFPGYSVKALSENVLGRSHRSKLCMGRITRSLNEQRQLLGIPSDYHIGIVPASDTGAVEMAMWNLLGPRPVDVVHFDAFGADWAEDIRSELKIAKVNELKAPYGQLPNLELTSPLHDIVFTWNGTTSGTRVPNGDWISASREGLTICDATSAVFAMPMPWDKLDVVTYSWQKALGGEGAHGMMILSPRAVARLNSFRPDRPIPKVFRLAPKGKFDSAIFKGSVINTISMLAVEDLLGVLKWAKPLGIGGLIQRTNDNMSVMTEFVERNPWVSFLCKDKTIRSTTSVCLTIDLPAEKVKKITELLASEHIAFDIDSYRSAPPGLRVWCGATIDKEDLRRLTRWIEWAYKEVALSA